MGELAVLLLLGAVHFVNLVDFMMVMPMGPDFASALGIPLSSLGIVGGSYTCAAFVVGLLGAAWLDHWPRRAALVAAVTGLGLATMSAAFAPNAAALIAARVAAGAFGGLAGTLCFSIVVDLVPDQRRGKGMAVVSSGYSLASIFGVPAGLELARRGGWRAPFLLVGASALALAAACRVALPVMRAHLETKEPPMKLALDEGLFLSFAAFGLAIFGNFLLIPNLSAFLQFNLGFARENLGFLYLLGGLASLATMRLAGVWTDRSGANPVTIATSVITAAVLVLGAGLTPPPLTPWLFFPLFMAANSMRWVSIYSLTSRLPKPATRARFLSAQTAFGHAACAAGSFASTRLLTVDAAGRLSGMPRLAAVAAVLGLGVPFVVRRLEAAAPKVRGSAA